MAIEIINSFLPKYEVEFRHPDHGIQVYQFFPKTDEAPIGISDKEWAEWECKVAIACWERYNHHHFWHTMTLTALWQQGRQVLFDDIGLYGLQERLAQVRNDIQAEEDEASADDGCWYDEEDEEYDFEVTAADLHDYRYGI